MQREFGELQSVLVKVCQRAFTADERQQLCTLFGKFNSAAMSMFLSGEIDLNQLSSFGRQPQPQPKCNSKLDGPSEQLMQMMNLLDKEGNFVVPDVD